MEFFKSFCLVITSSSVKTALYCVAMLKIFTLVTSIVEFKWLLSGKKQQNFRVALEFTLEIFFVFQKGPFC